MAPLRNPKHEAFVRHMLEGKDITTSFEGFNRDSGNANRLFRNPKVKERLAELQNEIAAKVPITIESLIGELEEARLHATGKNQFAAAIKAILGKAQLAGLLVDRSKVEVTNTDSLAGLEDKDEICLAVADNALKYQIEPYHDFREGDRQHLAQIYQRHMLVCIAEMDAYIEEIRARPLIRVTHLPKALPSTLNGKSDSQTTAD
jgi:hypothetical protein